MLRVIIGDIPPLSTPQAVARWLSPALRAQQPSGKRQASWLAGRVMLAWAVGTRGLPPLETDSHGKPFLPHRPELAFNLSHSDGVVALALSDAGAVGCDIERVRPRRSWPSLARAIFSEEEQAMLSALPEEARLPAFWQCWTRREALLKQRGGAVWELLQAPAILTPPEGVFLSDCRVEDLQIAVCACVPCKDIGKRLESLTLASL
ncbi:TPA: 4'-phosphopantetheinyl transferase AcpT [Cronobacter turicensis]|nr:4'-phosphopantetheinyl transferase AcpT [Cronobacter turicensis]